jgi:hypothetical protein
MERRKRSIRYSPLPIRPFFSSTMPPQIGFFDPEPDRYTSIQLERHWPPAKKSDRGILQQASQENVRS